MLRNVRKFSLRHEINLFVGNCQYLIQCSTVKVLSFQNMTWAFYLLIFRFKVIWRPSLLTKMVTFSLLWLKLWSLQALGTLVFFFGFFLSFYLSFGVCCFKCWYWYKKKFKPHKISLMNSSQYGSYCLTKKNEM